MDRDTDGGATPPDHDPLRQLEGWARAADRRARRGHTAQRLRRALSAPFRAVGRRPIAFISALLVVALAALFWYGRGWLPSPSLGGSRGYATQAPPSGVYATSTPEPTVDPNGPFALTPAAGWASGADGIAVPAAKAVTGFTAAAVRADLATVRKALIAGRLDNRMLVQHDPSAFLALLAPDARASLSRDIAKGVALGVVTRLADGASLSSWAPRVSGRTTYSSIKDRQGFRALRVITNYVWAYAFAGDVVVVLHDQVTWDFYRAGEVIKADVGLWVDDWDSYWMGASCLASSMGKLGPPNPDRPDSPTAPATENSDNYYQPDHAFDSGDSCPDTTASSTPTPTVTPTPGVTATP